MIASRERERAFTGFAGPLAALSLLCALALGGALVALQTGCSSASLSGDTPAAADEPAQDGKPEQAKGAQQAEQPEQEADDTATPDPAQPRDLSEAQLTVDDQTYTGFGLTPEATVVLDGETLVEGRDYTLHYANNVEVGEASVAAVALGDYSGMAIGSFAIEPHPAGWDIVNGAYCYYNEAGVRVTNSFVSGVDGRWYYLDASGNLAHDCWIASSGTYFKLDSQGHPLVNSWASYGDDYYYLNELGTPLRQSALIDDGSLYYFDNEGRMLADVWVERNGKTYHFGSDGRMATGLTIIDGEAYIFNGDGSLRAISNDARLDRIVCGIIRDHTGFDARAAYDYVAYGFSYLEGPTASDFSNWQEYYALGLVDSGEGNCFGFSALYHFLLKAMGYESKVIADTIANRNNGNTGDHCWVEVYVGGATYVCDPVLEVAYPPSINSYMITYAENANATTWVRYFG